MDYFFSDCDNDNQSLSNITLSPSMVKEFLDQLNISKSCGPDGITSRLLKELYVQNRCLFLFTPCSINNQTVVVFQKYGKLQIWSQFSSLMIESWLKITEEYHCCVSYQKFLKNVCSHMFFPFSNHKFTICKTAL